MNEPAQSGEYHPELEAFRNGDTVTLDLWYPCLEGHAKYIEVGLVDVRAADSIRISYDYARNGYVIEQARRFSWGPDEEVDSGWTEVAFVEAWAKREDEGA